MMIPSRRDTFKPLDAGFRDNSWFSFPQKRSIAFLHHNFKDYG